MNKAKLLLVEDDIKTAYLCKYALGEKDIFEITTAENGLEGLQKLKDEFFHIVVTDLLMPHMDGFQFLEKAKKSKEIKRSENFEQIYIVISALDRREDIHKAITLGAYDVIPKPLDMGLFKAKMSNYHQLYSLMLECEMRYQKIEDLNKQIIEGYENRLLENNEMLKTIQRQKEIYGKQQQIIDKINSMATSINSEIGDSISEECKLFMELENLGK